MKNAANTTGSREALRQAEAERITAEYVRRLNEESAKDTRGWIEQGRLVSEYIKARKNPASSREDLYKTLEDHPDSTLRASSLRNYKACYDLYVQFGGEGKAPKTSFSHFVLVLHSDLTLDDRTKFLALAVEKNLSVRQLKQAIDHRHDNTPSSLAIKTAATTLAKATQTLQKLTDQTYSALVKVNLLRQKTEAVPEKLKESLTALLQFAIFHRYVDPKDMQGNLE